jgi:hypothetical protein
MVEHTSGTLRVGECNIDRKLGEIGRRGTRRQVVDLVHLWERMRETDIMVDQLEALPIKEVLDGSPTATGEVIETDDVLTLLDKRLTEVATQKTGATSD